MSRETFNLSEVTALPKVELHCHLDGSISAKALRKMAALTGATLPDGEEALHDLITAPVETVSLVDYLKRFQIVVDLMQTKEQLRLAALDMVETAKNDGIIYLESRFAPALFTAGGLTIEEVLEAILDGFHEGEERYGVIVNAIVCAMRDQPATDNQRVFEIAAEYHDQGVVGFDFAGDEEHYPTTVIATTLTQAQTLGIPFTLHAGEAGPAENVADGLKLGIKRIGHGTHMRGHQDLIDECRAKDITIEMCLTSNLQTKAAETTAEFPFEEYLSNGLNITVNTDDRTVSDITLSGEFMALHDAYGLDYDLMKQVTLNAIHGAFLTDGEKQRLTDRVEAAYAE